MNQSSSLIAIISDTHDNTPVVQAVAEELKRGSYLQVIHCGDITTPDTLRFFSGLPLAVIFGNCDFDREGINREGKALGIENISTELELSLGGKDFYVYHGTKPYLIDEMAGAQLYDYVLHGHIHEVRKEVVGKTTVICPGALSRASEYTYCVLDIKKGTTDFRVVPLR